jgi:hypothetical protein
MNPQADNSDVGAHGERVLRRIQLLTLGFGAVVAAVALALHRADWAKGLLCGAALAWLNFRWLQSGIRGLFESALAQAKAVPEGSDPPASGSNSVTSGMLRAFSLLFRYALVGLGVYVIFIYLHVPLVSIGLGLCALVAAIVAASVWEALQPES